MNWHKISITLLILLGAYSLMAQKAWVTPERFNPDDSVTLYVDVSKTDCSRLMDTQDDLFMWAWNPAEPVGGNGEWTSSREELKMTRSADNPNIYYFKLVPNEFYSLEKDKDIYDNGFSFLVKKKDGTGEGGGGCDEDKTEDLNIAALPIPGCNTKYCQLPSTVFQDDYFTFIYNTDKEDKDSMQEDVVGVTNYGMFIRATLTNGDRLEIASYSEVINFPELRLTNDPADPRLYKNTFVPEMLFELTGDQQIAEMLIQVINVNYSGPEDVSSGRATIVIGCN